jgi:hypothetical protein
MSSKYLLIAVLIMIHPSQSLATVQLHQIIGVPVDPTDFDPVRLQDPNSEFRVGIEFAKTSTSELALLSRLKVERSHRRVPMVALTRLNDTVNFYSFLSSASSIANADASNIRSMSSESQELEIGAGPALRLGNISLGGAVSYLSLGSEQRTATTSSGTYASQAAAAAMPRMELWGSISGQRGEVRVGFKTYAGAEVDTKLEYNSNNYLLRSKRSLPGEFVIAGLLDVAEDLRIHIGIGARQNQQSSLPVDEFYPATGVIAAGGATAKAQGPLRDAASGYFYLSGLYRASNSLGLTSSVNYRQPSYREDHDASSFFGNLGYKSIAVGLSPTLANDSKLSFDVEFRNFDPMTYTANGSSQRWAEPNERVSLKGSEWLVGLQSTIFF